MSPHLCPIFHRFVTKFREAQQKLITTYLQRGSVHYAHVAQLSVTSHNYTLEHCKKIILTNSATRMLNALVADPNSYAIAFPFKPDPQPLWIEIEGETEDLPFCHELDRQIRGVLLDNIALQDNFNALKSSLSPTHYSTVASALEMFRGVRDVYLVGQDGSPLFEWTYDEKKALWNIPKGHCCPYAFCEKGDDGFTSRPCHRCQDAMHLFSSWLPIALVALEGAFRLPDNETLVSRVTRRERKANNPKKKQTVHVEHRLHIVRTIDISFKPPKPLEVENELGDPVVLPRGSWVKAVDPALVIHEVREVPQRIRTLTHLRYAKYIEKHGTNQVVVKAHQKSFPMLKSRVTRATAKRYDPKS